MNLGEKSAVEAMLGLSRPNNTTHPYYPTSSLLPKSLHVNCGSSISPSLSPVQHTRRPCMPSSSDIGRPKAMRLSQLLTDDSPPETSSFPSTHNCIPQRTPKQEHVPYSLHLPLSTSITAPPPPGLPATEPVTPPFSPPVLPPLSTVAGIAMRQQAVVNNNENTAPASSAWLPAPPPSIKTTSTVLVNRTSHSSNTRSTTETMKKIVKRPYKKYYSNPTPSSHCHVCARTSKAVKFAICARIAEGLCRKVTCYKCFAKFGWDWESAVNSKTWICVHCRGVCPEGRSQCYIYSRVNSKRECKRGKRGAQGQAKTQDVTAIVSQNVVTSTLPAFSDANSFGSLIRRM